MSLRSVLFCAIFCSIVPSSLAFDLSALQTRIEQGTNQNQATQILSELNAHLSQAPNDYAALFLKARVLVQINQMPEAEKTYRNLIDLDPTQPEAYNNLAKILVTKGDLEGAQTLLEKAMQTHPSYAAVYDNLSHIYVAKARDSYGKALRLESGKSQLELTELAALQMQPQTQPQTQSSLAPRTQSSTASIQTSPGKASPGVELTLSDQDAATATTTSDSSIPAFNENEIITTLQGWAAAWSEQSADVYFIFYADDYHPPGKSRHRWQQDRRKRLKKPSWIQIGLKEIEVKPINNKEAQVDLIQIYRASNYQDRTKKQIKLRQTPDGWRIIAERSVSN